MSELGNAGVELTEKDLLPEGVRADLEPKHGEIVAVEVKGKVFGFRGPNRKETKWWREMSQQKKADTAELGEKLLLTCCVYPSPEALSAQFDTFPLAVGSTLVAFQAGFGVDFEQLAIVK